ncbi:MAG: hypothetical protein QF570_08155 [Myxococcota bacterium]|nr:hypothetical protein [Myxococcota bacterium]
MTGPALQGAPCSVGFQVQGDGVPAASAAGGFGTGLASCPGMDHESLYYDDIDHACSRRGHVRMRDHRGPSPGIAAVLSVLIPGLGQVYNGRLMAGACWFLAASFAYWAVLVPGFIVHALCVWSAYRGARDWLHY